MTDTAERMARAIQVAGEAYSSALRGEPCEAERLGKRIRQLEAERDKLKADADARYQVIAIVAQFSQRNFGVCGENAERTVGRFIQHYDDLRSALKRIAEDAGAP